MIYMYITTTHIILGSILLATGTLSSGLMTRVISSPLAHGERAKSEEKTSEDKSVPEWEEEIVAENRDEGTRREEEEEPGEERGKVKKEDARLRKEKGAGGANEYILDGFDFSTGKYDDHYHINGRHIYACALHYDDLYLTCCIVI